MALEVLDAGGDGLACVMPCFVMLCCVVWGWGGEKGGRGKFHT